MAKAPPHQDDRNLPPRGLMGRTVFARRSTRKQELAWLRSRLAKCEIDPQLRYEIEDVIRRVQECPKAQDAIWPEPKGRKRSAYHDDIALHYLVLKEIKGRGKSVYARKRVEKVWGVKAATVAEIWTEKRHSAAYWLTCWIGGAERENASQHKSGITRNGVFYAYPDWTRETILATLDRELEEKAKRVRSSGK